MADVQAEQPKKWRKISLIAIGLLLPLLFFSYLFGVGMNFSLNDPDLWWHLRTGQYILENWETPEEDPFAYTTPRPLDEAKKIGLRSQWLGQVIFYLSYYIGGYGGIIVLRNILIVLPMLVLYIWLLSKGVKPWSAIIVISLPASMLCIQLFYSFERPQALSFLFAVIVVMLVERLRQQQQSGKFNVFYVLLPLVMALWSNIHAGYIIGNIIIIIYMAAEALMPGIRKLLGKKPGMPHWAFFAVTAVSIVASFMNPNTYKIFWSYLSSLVSLFLTDVLSTMQGGAGGWVGSTVLEFKSLFYFYKYLGYTWLVFYWVFTGFLYVLMILKYWQKRKIDIAELVVVIFITLFANMYARGLMFSLTILPFYMAKNITEITMPSLRYRVIFRGAIAVVLAISIGFYANSYNQVSLRPGITRMLISPWYPIGVAEFLRAYDIPGPMYNFYTWGGFLIWALYPKYQVFIDGRALDEMTNTTADAILKTYPGWQDKLKAYNINFIVVPVVFRESGHMIPVAVSLVDDNDWRLIYLRNNSAMFIRDIPMNKDIISSYNIDKKNIYSEIISIENIFLISEPDHPVYNLAKAQSLFMLGRYGEAKAIYEKFPEDAASELKHLKELGY